MVEPLSLTRKSSFVLVPKAPYHFDANVHKPSHFPSSDNAWEPGTAWITMRWRGMRLGLRLQDRGTIDAPRVGITVFSRAVLPAQFLGGIREEIAWRFNFRQDLSDFTEAYVEDPFLGGPIKRWRGMRPVAANSLYETLMIYVVIQNTVIRRSIAMLEALFDRFGRDVRFDGQTLSTFWTPREMLCTSEQEMRALKVGYRAKTLLRLTKAFTSGTLDERALRGAPRPVVENALGSLYGVGPTSLSYLLYEDFYFLSDLRVVPPWERKIMSRLLFDRRLVPERRILRFFRSRYPGYEKLAFNYL
jgi:3-methyladenine DNA glycosylase/8-oxoguanine DNA glycosylase